MERLALAVVLFAACHATADPEAIGEFKRMPELRGQSFGLENFLMQPFNLAQSEGPHRPQRKRINPQGDSYSVEFEVNEDFDMRRLLPTLPGASMVFDQEKPVHEDIEEPPPPPRRIHHERRRRPPVFEEGLESQTERPHRPTPTPTQSDFIPKQSYPPKLPSLEDEIQSLVLDGQTERPFKQLPSLDEEIESLVGKPNDRRPLEKPSEFMVSIAQHVEPYPSIFEEKPERTRKRVMKRRRKRPTTPAPEEDEVKEVVDNSFLPTSYQETVKDTTGSESIVIEHGQPGRRRPPPGYKKPEVRNERLRLDKLLSDPIAAQSENQQVEVATDPPSPGESTQRLKTLLKQQNGQLSLSELLQTQNLSLADFLKGNPGALSALGGTKVSQATESSFTPVSEKPKERSAIPKISSKSRPFSKPNATKPSLRRSTTVAPTTEESVPELPKKLQIIEVTSDKPTYNGFAPKRPRLRPGQKIDFKSSRENLAETSTQKSTTTTTTTEKEEVEQNEEEDQELDIQKNETENEVQTTTKAPAPKTSTAAPTEEVSTTTELKPKRFGEFRPKFKVDRRKPVAESTTEGSTDKSQEVDLTVSSTTEEPIKSTRGRVRIPFQSVNNPEITVILPSKKISTTTEKPRPSPVIKDRINVFKRINSEEKTANENTIESQEKILQDVTSSTTPKEDEEEDEEATGQETSDEIIQLLKAGKQAVRLQRILSARNMTVSELVEKRANSSRQPNVTKLFEKRLTSSERLGGRHKVTHVEDNHQITEKPSAPLTTKRIIPVFDILSPNYKSDNDKMRVRSEIVKPTNAFDELFVDESVVRPIKLPIDENREAKSYDSGKETKPNRVQLSPGIEGKPQQPVPLWNIEEKIYSSKPYGYPTYDMNTNLAKTSTTDATILKEEETLIFETINTEDPNSRLKSSINDILKERVEIVKELKDDNPSIPPAVKSAIIASGVVMGIALVVFVAIFATCGWKQRQFRLRARSSILNDSIDGSRKAIRRTGTLSPVSFKRSALYKKSIDFDTESSVSGSSNTSSYLWNTLKNTFQSRNSTLKNRQEKEDKIQERENRSRRNTLCREEERPRNNTMAREDPRREFREIEPQMPRRNTLTREDARRDETRRDSLMSRDTLNRDSVISSRDLVRTESRRSSCLRDDRRGVNNLVRENERCSFRTIDPDRHIIQTSVNFKRGGRDNFDNSRHFDKFESCDHFN